MSTKITSNHVYLKTDTELLHSLIADEAKQAPIIAELLNTVKQLQAKNRFRLALLNQLLENYKEPNK